MAADGNRAESVIKGVVIALALLLVSFWALVACGLHARATSSPQEPGASSSAVAGTGPVDAVVKDLDAELNSGFLSPGQTYGGPFTEGTVVAQVEAHGGVVLALGSATEPGGPNTVTVLFGATASGGTPDCYRYTFTIQHDSAQGRAVPCPGGATTVRLARTLLTQPRGGEAFTAAPGTYPVTAAGVRGLLRDRFGPTTATTPFATATTSAATGTPVLAAAVRVHDVCYFLRLGTSTTIGSWVPVWQAPVDDQPSCTTAGALASATLYGSDPAQEG